MPAEGPCVDPPARCWACHPSRTGSCEQSAATEKNGRRMPSQTCGNEVPDRSQVLNLKKPPINMSLMSMCFDDF